MKHLRRLSIFLLAAWWLAPAAPAATPPNLLILLVDDMGWNGVGFHHPSSPTPNLNRLAGESLELQRFYTYPVCSPARAALLTGQMPRRFGLADVIAPGQEGIPTNTLTLPRLFHSASYSTTLIGKWHLGATHPPRQCGFDHFYGFLGAEIDYYQHTGLRGGPDWQRDGTNLVENGYSTDLLADEAVRQIQGRDPRRPFFIEVAFNAPHVPLSAPPDLVAQYATNGGLYDAVLARLDQAIGRILDAVADPALRTNTLVLFYSDNGAPVRQSDNSPLRAGKDTVYEGGIRTPCLLRWPGHTPSGVATQQPVAAQDLLPTLAAAAGLTLPADAAVHLDGINQWPALQTGQLILRPPILIASHEIALIDGDWKLIAGPGDRRELYHLSVDPAEARDEFAHQPELARRLGAQLDALAQDLPAPRPRRGPPAGRGAPGGPGSGRGMRRGTPPPSPTGDRSL